MEFSELRQLTYLSTDDIPLYLVCCGIYFLYRVFMCYGMLRKIGKALHVKSLFKFEHRGFDLIHYATSTILGIIALQGRPYSQCFYFARDCSEQIRPKASFEVTYIEKAYFMLVLVYYTIDILFIWTSSEPVMMTIHHIVTVGLIISCVSINLPVVGISIMLLHDITDLPLYLGKIFVYLNFSFLKDFTLVVFALSCSYFRIINFPIIIYKVYQECWNIEWRNIIYRIDTSSLVILYGLHIFWEAEIFRNIYKIMKGNPIHDDRSD
ncbi:longevity assurance protein [Tritrichomonas foetus]|uniref:Longevity assurance protein n=1 Tax=Tritrichomonas foetus TaxID=1144522 RepID=A0A1J4JZL6_9EUKA|nr:longevity assurance protein [Tritrichomonas foetus]|eukprot:OHT04427.1 longevity assurance protein [Tritrichomonas foetus]